MNCSNLVVMFVLSLMIGTNPAHAFGRPRPTPTPVPAPVTYNYSQEELEGLQLMNQHRVSLGLTEATRNDFISTQCLDHDTYMIKQGKPSHDYFTDRANAIKARIGAERVGEVVAYNYITPHSALSAWLNSDGHRKVIENTTYKRVGYSIRSTPDGKKYHTMIFSN